VFDQTANLALTYTITENSGSDIQLYYADWSDKLTFYVDGVSHNADYNPSGSKGTTATANITFSESVYNTIKQKGLIIHGTGVTLTKAIMKSGTTGISAATFTPSGNQPIYNLQGQRISKPKKGLYIQNGKKYIAR